MYNIKVEAYFSAAHNLRGYRGKCEELHGHNWKVEVVVEKERLDKVGMVLDFRTLKRQLNSILEKLDHRYLNRIPYFRKINPTSENIARYIYNNIKPQVPNIKSVIVWENNACCATYEPRPSQRVQGHR
jgi:6-pyruvoyltetrahydropterin/6-carboxytetrahydropterin synthase